MYSASKTSPSPQRWPLSDFDSCHSHAWFNITADFCVYRNDYRIVFCFSILYKLYQMIKFFYHFAFLTQSFLGLQCWYFFRSFISTVVLFFIAWIWHGLFIHFPTDEPLCFFHILAIKHHAHVLNILVHFSLCTYVEVSLMYSGLYCWGKAMQFFSFPRC